MYYMYNLSERVNDLTGAQAWTKKKHYSPSLFCQVLDIFEVSTQPTFPSDSFGVPMPISDATLGLPQHTHHQKNSHHTQSRGHLHTIHDRKGEKPHNEEIRKRKYEHMSKYCSVGIHQFISQSYFLQHCTALTSNHIRTTSSLKRCPLIGVISFWIPFKAPPL